MKCKKCGKEIDLLEEYCNDCKQIVMQEELNTLIEENKEMNKLEDTKELENLSNLKEEQPEENVLKEELKDIVKVEEEPIVMKKNNQKIVYILISFISIILMFVIILILLSKKEQQSLDKVEINYKNIINEYGLSVESTVSDFMKKDNEIPTWKSINTQVKYDKYKVVCDIHEIYEDGKVYLNSCKVDNKKTKYEYGKKQEKMGMEIKIYQQVAKDNTIYYNNVENKTLVGSIICETDECEYVEAYEKYVVVKEKDQHYIYNYEENKKEYGPFNIEKDLLVSFDNKLHALVYDNNIYNFNTKKLVENIEGNLLMPEYGLNIELLYKYGYVIFTSNNTNNFINLKTGNISYSIYGKINNIIESSDEKIVYITTINESNLKTTIYNSNGKKLFYGKEFNNFILSGDKVIVSNDNNFYVYDTNLKLNLTSKTYTRIFDIYNSMYFAVVNDKKVSIVDIEDNLLATFEIEWDEYIYTFIKDKSNINTNEKKITLTFKEQKDAVNIIHEYYYNYETREISSKTN